MGGWLQEACEGELEGRFKLCGKLGENLGVSDAGSIDPNRAVAGLERKQGRPSVVMDGKQFVYKNTHIYHLFDLDHAPAKI